MRIHTLSDITETTDVIDIDAVQPGDGAGLLRVENRHAASLGRCAMIQNTPLTARQQDVYAFIRSQLASGISPTVREIVAAIGASSPNAVAGHLRALQRHGLIRREPHRARSIRLASSPLQLPFRGDVS